MAYSNQRGGGYKNTTKDFKADPVKQYLISRGSARDRAVDLCCAGKITLEQIPEYTDKLTVLHFGHISVDPKVDAEVMRIAQRVRDRATPDNKQDESKEPEAEEEQTPDLSLCPKCSFGPEGTGECDEGGTGEVYTACAEYDEMETD